MSISGNEERVAMQDNTSDQMTDTGFEPQVGRSVSLDHAADMLGVSRRTIYNRIREGRLTTIRTLGGSQRVLIDSVRDVLRPLRLVHPVRPPVSETSDLTDL
jgi:excisionase family DNA binding protein